MGAFDTDATAGRRTGKTGDWRLLSTFGYGPCRLFLGIFPARLQLAAKAT